MRIVKQDKIGIKIHSHRVKAGRTVLLKEFTYVIRSGDGKKYEFFVSGRSEGDAERRVNKFFDALSLNDTVSSEDDRTEIADKNNNEKKEES